MLLFVPCVRAYVDVLIATCVPVTVCRYRERVRELNELFALHDGVNIPAGARDRAKQSTLPLQLRVLTRLSCNSLPSPWALQPPHPRGGFLASLVVLSQESRVTRLLHVRCACSRSPSSVHAGSLWTSTSVYRHYSRARCTERRAPAEEKDDEEDDGVS